MSKIFSESGIGEVKGMFSTDHLIFTISGIILLLLLVWLFRKISREQVKKIIIVNFIILFTLEILKIIWIFITIDKPSLNNWVPLYFCSLFIYGSGMFTIGDIFKLKCSKFLKYLGVNWIVYGQIIAGISFLCFPTSSIGIRPLFHILTIHSFVYHLLASFTGLLILVTGYYQIGNNHSIKYDFINYFCTLLVISLVVYIINCINNVNLMFLNDPFNVTILIGLKKVLQDFYFIPIAIGQIVITFVGGLSIGLLINKFKTKKNEINIEG